MDIQLAAEERIYLIEERLSPDEIQQRAMDRRVQAFGGGLGGLLQRPKTEDVVLLERQRRLEPFWHVACRARYVYERNREYLVPASAPEVHAVSVQGTTYDVQDGRQPRAFTLSASEHCREEYALERYTDGMTGAPTADAATLLGGPRSEVSDPSSLSADGTVVLPPEHRASFVVRKLLAEMMKPLQADAVTEETLTLEATDLYYRPMWAFEFHWKPRDKKGVVEIDAVTGQTRQGQSLLPQLKGMVSRDMLFDIGADTAGMLIPGGSIAVKVAKAAMDKNR
jgi:hypothetical protein